MRAKGCAISWTPARKLAPHFPGRGRHAHATTWRPHGAKIKRRRVPQVSRGTRDNMELARGADLIELSSFMVAD
jgi:hypothetical protein